MIFWAPAAILFSIFLFYSLAKKNSKKQNINDLLVATVITSAIVFIVSLIVSGIVISHKADLARIDKDITVAQERSSEIEAVILSYVEKYPLEEKLLKSFNPVVLLSLPNIKSDEFLRNQINLAVQLRDMKYQLELEKNKIEKNLDFHSNRWFSPTFASPKYKRSNA
jgi:hypothetical protein